MARGLCVTHYSRVLKFGDLRPNDPVVPKGRDQLERFFEKILVDEEARCWLWGASLTADGYGLLDSRAAHRIGYELLVEPIADGLELDHLCRVRRCVNPGHLEPVTSQENTRRSPIAPAALNALKTHCPQGHPYDDANTRVARAHATGNSLGRWCRACDRAHQQAYQQRKKARAAVSS